MTSFLVKRTIGLVILGALLTSCSKENDIQANQNTTECGDNTLDCVPCSPGEHRCDGATLKVCQADGQGFDAVAMCSTAALCVKGLAVGLCAPPVCYPADTRCDGARMTVCSPGQDELIGTDCPSVASCTAGLKDGRCAAGECSGPAECTGVDTECRKRTCEAGECGFLEIAQGTVVVEQTDGDCRTRVCDGHGGIEEAIDNSDVPSDGNSCTLESCDGGSPTEAKAPFATPCTGGACDGKGNCVNLPSACGNINIQSFTATEFISVSSPSGGAYFIDATEVTRSEYCAWLATAPTTDGQPTECASNTDFDPSCACTGTNCGRHPQTCIDWCDAHAYCKAKGKRLCGRIGGGPGDPDDLNNAELSQWYNACSSGGTRTYTYGDACEPHSCNLDDHGVGATVGVGDLPGCHSPDLGFYAVSDLTGNVAEWVDTCKVGLDLCHIRGGSFLENCGTDPSGTSCMAPWAAQRLGKGEQTGFRCCSDP